MRLIGLLITIVAISLLFIWWLNLSLGNTNKAINQSFGEGTGASIEQNTSPVDYTEKLKDEVNEATEQRAKEYEEIK
jgi:hypothetical protein